MHGGHLCVRFVMLCCVVLALGEIGGPSQLPLWLSGDFSVRGCLVRLPELKPELPQPLLVSSA